MKALSILFTTFLTIFFFGCQKENLTPTDLALELANVKGGIKGVKYGKMRDIDKNKYLTVEICSQVWMAENLHVTRYKNGDPIPQVTDPEEWTRLTTGAWCYLDNDPANEKVYGKLYNWYAINDARGLAPEGWSIPDIFKLLNIVKCVGGNSGIIKETGTTHWASPNIGATNTTGFTALPGGMRNANGIFKNNHGEQAYFWSSSESAIPGNPVPFPTYPMSATLRYENTIIGFNWDYRNCGYSVRCIQN